MDLNGLISDKKEFLVFTFNMTPIAREGYTLGVPKSGFYEEIFNSDAIEYGGTGLGNLGGINSVEKKHLEYENSIDVTLPPLAVNIFKIEESNQLNVRETSEE